MDTPLLVHEGREARTPDALENALEDGLQSPTLSSEEAHSSLCSSSPLPTQLLFFLPRIVEQRSLIMKTKKSQALKASPLPDLSPSPFLYLLASLYLYPVSSYSQVRQDLYFFGYV